MARSDVWKVLGSIARDPWQLLRAWNYKSAVLSSLSRALLFYLANASAGHAAARQAFLTEIWFRLLTSGFYGALTQRLRDIEPAWKGMVAAIVILPICGHGLEVAVHWWRGTAELSRSIAVSVGFTILTTAFNVFAMRRGALIVGAGGQPLLRDLVRMPSLMALFVVTIASSCLKVARGRTRVA